MARKPVVSVIVPAFNAEATLSRAVESALAQTFEDLEILIVDDLSSDQTLAVAEELAAADERVRVFSQSARQGPASARNLAISHSSAEWIALLDADDEFQPERIAALVQEANDLSCDFLADNLLLKYTDGQPSRLAFDVDLIDADHPLSLREFLERDVGAWPTYRPIAYCKPLIRREFLCKHELRYDPRAFVGQDFNFYVAALSLGAKFHLTPEAYYLFTVDQRSHSNNDLALQRVAQSSALAASLYAGSDRSVRKLLRLRTASFHYLLFKRHLQRGNIVEALKIAHKVDLRQLACGALKALRGFGRRQLAVAST